MSKVISLREIIAALEATSDDCTSYLDPETGEIIVVTEEERALAEDPCGEEAPAWEGEMMPKIRAALESDRFLELQHLPVIPRAWSEVSEAEIIAREAVAIASRTDYLDAHAARATA
jgi:hypothetical protein